MTHYHRITLSCGASKLSCVLREEDVRRIQRALLQTGERFAVWYVAPGQIESVCLVIDPTCAGAITCHTSAGGGNTDELGQLIMCPLPPPPPVTLDVAALLTTLRRLPGAAQLLEGLGVSVPDAGSVDPRPDLRRLITPADILSMAADGAPGPDPAPEGDGINGTPVERRAAS